MSGTGTGIVTRTGASTRNRTNYDTGIELVSSELEQQLAEQLSVELLQQIFACAFE